MAAKEVGGGRLAGGRGGRAQDPRWAGEDRVAGAGEVGPARGRWGGQAQGTGMGRSGAGHGHREVVLHGEEALVGRG